MISTMADGSMKLPATSKMMLTRNRNMITPKPCVVIHAAIAWGICSEVSRNENSTALVMM